MLNSRQNRYLARNPSAMARYLATGRPPRTYRPTSPLIEALERLDPRVRTGMAQVTLSPALGYRSDARFANAEALLRWLKPAPELVEGEAHPAESRREKRFRGPISGAELARHCGRLSPAAKRALETGEEPCP